MGTAVHGELPRRLLQLRGAADPSVRERQAGAGRPSRDRAYATPGHRGDVWDGFGASQAGPIDLLALTLRHVRALLLRTHDRRWARLILEKPWLHMGSNQSRRRCEGDSDRGGDGCRDE